MTILDIDLDAFVEPPVENQVRGAPRPQDDEHKIAEPEVIDFLLKRWLVTKATPLVLLESHEEILDPIQKLIAQDTLQLPFTWYHVDAHDDFYGNGQPPITCANFMFEVVRRNWAQRIFWFHPPQYAMGPSDFVYDQNALDIVIDHHRVPIRLHQWHERKLEEPPAFAFLCRSPEFSPAKADALFDHIASRFTVTTVC